MNKKIFKYQNTLTGVDLKAVIFKNHRISIADVAMPVLQPNEALVKVSLAGICETDLSLLNGYHDFSGIPGHEFAGTVVSAPDNPDLEGCRVVADINCGCGQCYVCRIGDYRHCPHRTVLGIRGRNGVFAQFCAIPVSNLYAVPDRIKDNEAVFAEPLAAALAIDRQEGIGEKSRVAVLGDGKLGLLCALALRQKTADIVLIGRHPEKLRIVEARGVHTVCRQKGSAFESLEMNPEKFDVVIDATGRPDGINAALCLVRPKGTVIIKTTSSEKSVIDLADVVVREVRLIGSRCGDIKEALDFMERKRIEVGPLIEAVYPLDDFARAFAHASKSGSRKILVRP